MRLVVVGASGRMGCELIRAIDQNDKTELCGAIVRSGSTWLGKDVADILAVKTSGIKFSDDATAAFAQADGVLDFTSPEPSLDYAELAVQAEICFITGTTGFSADQEKRLTKASHRIALVKSGNMSLGVTLLAEFVERASRTLSAESFDIEISEMHHRHKVDAPSGTALLLGQAAAEGRAVALEAAAVFDRNGQNGPRQRGTIGFSSQRGGTVVGDHSVIFAGENERLVFSHFAQNRSIFANGALTAALWAQNQTNGLYSMRDVLGLERKNYHDTKES